jgi:hypothetical protein
MIAKKQSHSHFWGVGFPNPGAVWRAGGGRKDRSTSFLKKRSKKLLLIGCCLPAECANLGAARN